MRFFIVEGVDLLALHPDGRAALWCGDDWYPRQGSRMLAKEAFGTGMLHEVTCITDKVLSGFKATVPIFPTEVRGDALIKRLTICAGGSATRGDRGKTLEFKWGGDAARSGAFGMNTRSAPFESRFGNAP